MVPSSLSPIFAFEPWPMVTDLHLPLELRGVQHQLIAAAQVFNFFHWVFFLKAYWEFKGQKISKVNYGVFNSPKKGTMHRGVICQFLFRWIFYCHSSKSTGKKTAKTHLCAVPVTRISRNAILTMSRDPHYEN